MFDGLAIQFGALWDSCDTPPDVFAFLQQHVLYDPSEKLYVLLQDQQRRWRTDHPLKVEDYLARLSDLGTDPNIKLQLAVGEFQALQSSGSVPSIEEFASRFSDLSDALRSRLSDLAGILDGAGEYPDFASTKTYITESTLEVRYLGRYRLLSVLGEGAFGRVYLGFDEELQRRVAIKVPTARHFQKPQDAEAYLAEARTVASLDHPNIVPVHDVGRLEDGSIYVVSKFIEGRSLKDLMQEQRSNFEKSTQLIATIAQALHHAHEKRLIHRDVKPANILIDENTDTAYIADFGLAIREEMYVPDCTVTGTPAYMSPEQARGEGHRLDARSDIFSMGVVYYELLTGKKPFRGSSNNEILHNVIAVDPIDPRQLDDSIPPELERICLKAISKRASERYPTAAIFADDLLHWQQAQQQQTDVKIVPKGLRSFDAGDANFFLDLLPGPRDRDDLPESIYFWKTNAEELDADKTFSVGLIYGPSGCGKTSLVKAGLMPRLSKSIMTVYVEATPAETESRILSGFRKKLPELPPDFGLVETFALLRRRQSGKVVLILDQFEQWLHAIAPERQSELVSALRQCDGGALQTILMVRDDFAMAAARFMDELDVPIRQGHNFATVDFFGVDHAQKVLMKFGQAFGKLPERADKLLDEQREFVRQVSSGLAQDGKVVSVRLALFAEMVKNKPWVPATLEEVGGTEGIGLNFLDETFNSRTANPDHRLHQQAAREVLKALLPEVGTDIKGHMRSHADLLEASGYENRPGAFNHLLRILDGELRLITPTDQESLQTGATSDPSAKYYQLTHDYLVPVLREWITRKQRETRRGRAELRLAQRAAIWNLQPERRHLPSLWEYLQILTFASRNNRDPAERRMMDAAARVHGLRSIAASAIIGTILVGLVIARNRFVESQNHAKADALVGQLLVADIAEVPDIVESLDQNSARIMHRLTEVADDPNRSEAEHLRATLALADRPGEPASQLIRLAATADLPTIYAIRGRLKPFDERLTDELWQVARRDTLPLSSRLRIGTLLSQADPHGRQWQEVAPSIVEALLAENTLDLDTWVELLRPAANSMTPILRNQFFDSSAASTDRVTAARVLARYADAALLGELLLNANASQFSVLLPATSRSRSEVIETMREAIRKAADEPSEADPLRRAMQLRNAAITLIRLDEPADVEMLLANQSDPTARTMVLLEMRDFGVSPVSLINIFHQWQEPSARQAILLALEPYLGQEMSPRTKEGLLDLLTGLFRHGKHQTERSASEWLLQRWGRGEEIEKITRQLAGRAPESMKALGDRDWWVTPEGHTMRVIRGPVVFKLSLPHGKSEQKTEGPLIEATIPYSFAVSIHEVTMEQYRRFEPEAEFMGDFDDKVNCPANAITFSKATAYCQWLSRHEGMAEDQLCYGTERALEPETAAITEQQLLRTGYRLLTDMEWECVCRGGTITPWFSGVSEQHLTEFAWFAPNTDQKVLPIGMLRPNPLGLFDIAGNVAEWCHTELSDGEKKFVLRGGAYFNPARGIRSFAPYFQTQTGWSYTGLRIARTLPPGESPAK